LQCIKQVDQTNKPKGFQYHKNGVEQRKTSKSQALAVLHTERLTNVKVWQHSVTEICIVSVEKLGEVRVSWKEPSKVGISL